ncbi:MAG: globin [Caulobacterales bacterium]|nr:globin [Caulobacterales bacterium]
MSASPAFAHAAAIEASLERVAELCPDPTPLVYARLFAQQPQMAPLFWRDTKDSIKGEMLARAFDALLDFVGERRYAGHMIGTELVTHEGYDVPREVFATFFTVVAETVQEILGDEWTAEIAAAWRALLAEIDLYVQRTPRTDVVSPAMDERRRELAARFEAS